MLKSQAFQECARQRRAQLIFAEDKAAAAIDDQGSPTTEHQTAEQAEGDDPFLVGCDRLVEQRGCGDQLPGVGLAGLLELERQKGGFQLVEGGGVSPCCSIEFFELQDEFLGLFLARWLLAGRSGFPGGDFDVATQGIALADQGQSPGSRLVNRCCLRISSC